MPAYRLLLVPPKRSVMSPVMPLPLGTILLRTQVLPPSMDTKIGALVTPPGFEVKADPAISRGFAGLTARFGSLSWPVSPLSALGIMFTTVTWAPAREAESNHVRTIPDRLGEAFVSKRIRDFIVSLRS